MIEVFSRNMNTDIPEARRKALEYSEDLIVIDPARPEGYSSMAAIPYHDWLFSKPRDLRSAREAVGWINEYIKHETRPGRAQSIATIRRILVKLNASLAAQDSDQSRSK